MQMNRLFEIVYILMERKTVTAAELAERFEVSTRTIYRDMDTLSSAGIPVYCTKGKGGGIGLLPDFVLNKSLLTEEEQNEILFGLQSLTATHAADSGLVLSKLSSLFQKDEINWIGVDFSHWGSGEIEKEMFGRLKTAILQSRVITFTYYSSKCEKSERQVEPMRLQFKNRAWYLQGYCLQKQDFRSFKMSRIENVQFTGEPFERRQKQVPDFDSSVMRPEQVVRLELEFSPRIAFRIFDEFDRSQVIRTEDGSLKVSVWYPEDEWVYGYLLSFGEDVRVISPAHIRRILREKAKNIASLYDDSV